MSRLTVTLEDKAEQYALSQPYESGERGDMGTSRTIKDWLAGAKYVQETLDIVDKKLLDQMQINAEYINRINDLRQLLAENGVFEGFHKDKT